MRRTLVVTFGLAVVAACASFSSSDTQAPPDGGAEASSPPPLPPPPPADDGGRDAGDAGDGGASAYASTVLGDGPIAYWRMGVTNKMVVPDATGHGHDLVLFGSVTLGVAGAIANDPDTAIRFDETTTSASPNTSAPFAFEGRVPFTIECWAKHEEHDASADFEHLVSYFSAGGGGPTNGYILFLRDPGSGDTNVTGTWLSPEAGAAVASAAQPPVDTFAYYALVFDGMNLTLYVDDGAPVFVSPGGSGGIESQTGEQLTIGRAAAGGFPYHFDGVLDEIAIYDTALAATQIAAHYAAARP